MKTSIKCTLVIAITIFLGCKKQDSVPVASEPAPNAYVRSDNASDDIDHQIFLVYKQTGIPILYTDTLSRSPLNILNLNFQIGGPSSIYQYTYPKKKADILTGVNFIRDRILPPLGSKIKIYSISLLDSLKTVIKYSATYSLTTNYSFVPGLTSFGIANIPKLATMSPGQLATFRADVLTNILIAPLNASTSLTGFYAVSAAYYSRYVYGTVTDASYLQYKDKKEYGFIPTGSESTSFYQLGDQTADLKDYLNKIFTMSAADFQARYGAYPLVMSKYNLLKGALTSMGFDLTKI